MTAILGPLQASMLAVYVSIGAALALGIVVVVSIARHRSGARMVEALASLADDAPDSAPSSPDPIDDLGSRSDATVPAWPPVAELRPWSALEPSIELDAPGPGVLGRLRRRPLADLATSRPVLESLGDNALDDDAPTSKGGSNAKTRPTQPRSRSTSRSTGGPTKKKPASTRVSTRKTSDRSSKGPKTKVSATRASGARNASQAARSSGTRQPRRDGGTSRVNRERVGDAP